MHRLIAVIDDKRGMAKNGQIPWNLPSDKARFRQLTLNDGANVLMGRTTYELMPKDFLSTHNNYIVSHSNIKLPEGDHLINNVEEFLMSFKGDIWNIGGAGLFASTIKYADELYLTHVDGDYNCDQFFPDYSDFKLKDSEAPLTENGLTFTYQTLTRF